MQEFIHSIDCQLKGLIGIMLMAVSSLLRNRCDCLLKRKQALQPKEKARLKKLFSLPLTNKTVFKSKMIPVALARNQ
jgi:hypothetical protein